MSSIARFFWFWELFFEGGGGEVCGGGRADWGSAYWGPGVEAQVSLGSLVGWLARPLVVLFFGLRWSGAPN